MKLALGTVQFGLNYGISNRNGKVDFAEIENILEFAKLQNVKTLDTAQGYGDSEKILGQFDLSNFKIITKIKTENILETSLKNLNKQNVYGLMFHDETEVNDVTWAKFESYKSQKTVEKIGVSVYSPEELERIIKRYPIDIVQLPMNLLDQRFLPILPELKGRNIEIHTRSAFLQGLILMNEGSINPYFDPIKPVLTKIPEPKLATALGFMKNIPETDKIVVGVTSKKELEEICLMYNKDVESMDFSQFKVDDEKFINPSKWEI